MAGQNTRNPARGKRSKNHGLTDVEKAETRRGWLYALPDWVFIVTLLFIPAPITRPIHCFHSRVHGHRDCDPPGLGIGIGFDRAGIKPVEQHPPNLLPFA